MYDLKGNKYNRLLVIKRTESKGAGRQIYWECLCDCGNTTVVDSWSLRNNRTKSCGCWRSEIRGKNSPSKHKMYNTRTYHSWEQMKQRCLNPKATRYPEYGARGITVCERWLDFQNFYQDMGTRPVGKTLDRINPYGNYEPNNCRWATYKEQVHNRRRNYIISEEVTPLC